MLLRWHSLDSRATLQRADATPGWSSDSRLFKQHNREATRAANIHDVVKLALVVVTTGPGRGYDLLIHPIPLWTPVRTVDLAVIALTNLTTYIPYPL